MSAAVSPRELAPGAVIRSGGKILVGIVILAATVRFATLGVQSFSDDELFTAWLTRMPFADMVATIPRTEATPHLFYLLEWVCVRLFGHGEVGMRLLPATAGTLTVVVVYVTGTLARSRRAGLVAATLAAVEPFLVWYSQEARAYALLMLFVALGLMWLVSYRRDGRRTALVGWAAAGVAALATHYFAVFLIAPEAAWLILTGSSGRRLRAGAVALPLLAGLGLLPLALHQRATVSDPGGVRTRGLLERVAAVPKNFLVGFSIPIEAFAVVLAGGLAALALGLALRTGRAQGHRAVLLVAMLAAAGIALPVLLALVGFDYVSSRNVVAALVPVTVVLGCGFATARAGLVGMAVMGVLSLVIIVGIVLDSRYQRPNWRGAALALGPARRDRLVIFHPPFSNPGPFRIYFGRRSWLWTPAAPPVDEVAVVGLADKNGFGPGSPKPPGGRAPRAPAGFRLEQDSETTSYRLIRFTSSSPLRVTAGELSSLVLPSTPSVAVWQGADNSSSP